MRLSKGVTERFFIIEGEHAAPIIKETYRRLKERDEACRAVSERYGTTEFFFGFQGRVVGLAFKEKAEREGLRLDPAWMLDDHYRYVPHRGTKKGKAIDAELKAIPSFDPHHFLLSELHAHRGITGDYVSGGGFRVHHSGAGIHGKAIVLRMPEREDEKFEAPAHFREIRESEFIAIVKEGAKP